MVSIIKKGGVAVDSLVILCGKSTDTKPTDSSLPNGSRFQEIDTSKEYIYDAENKLWYELPKSSSGSGIDFSNAKRKLLYADPKGNNIIWAKTVSDVAKCDEVYKLVNNWDFSTNSKIDTINNTELILGNGAILENNKLSITYGNNPYLRDYAVFPNVKIEPNTIIVIDIGLVQANYDGFGDTRHGTLLGFGSDDTYSSIENGLVHCGDSQGKSYGWQILKQAVTNSNIIKDTSTTIDNLFKNKTVVIEFDSEMIMRVFVDDVELLTSSQPMLEFDNLILGSNNSSFSHVEYNFVRIYKE